MKNENHCGAIARIRVTNHPDPEVHSLAVGTCLNETVIVSKSTEDNTLGIYFSCDLQLSSKFAESNDLIRRKDAVTGKPLGGMFDPNRKVRAQTFRGIKSYGFWAPLSYLTKCGVDITKLKEGDYVDSIGDIEICCKYESPEQRKAKIRERKKLTPLQKVKAYFFKKEKPITLFPEHKDTAHITRNMHRLRVGDDIVITEKMEGTSQRVAWNYQLRPRTLFERFMSYFVNVDNREMRKYNGTRRVTLTDTSQGGYFSESWRAEVASKVFPYIKPHTEIYFEVVGYEGQRSIAPKQDIKDKALKEKYGPKMVYSYGLPEGEYDIYVYRIAYVLESGEEVDWPWKNIKAFCNSHHLKHAPEIARFVYDGDEAKFIEMIKEVSDGPSVVDPRHIREGVCVRADGMHWTVFKNKGWTYKELAGLAQEKVGFVDPEDAS